MDDWQPIETAPKDFTWILVFDPESDGQYVACWISEVEDFVPCGWDIYGDGITPTHWMPLPAPPKVSA